MDEQEVIVIPEPALTPETAAAPADDPDDGQRGDYPHPDDREHPRRYPHR
jgi:hypothetical protein